MERVRGIHEIGSLQPPYSMITADAEKQRLPYCAEHEIGVVAYSPMCKGLLTGTFARERAARLGADDHRSRDPKFSEPQLNRHLELVERLKTIAAEHSRSVAELAIAWVLRRAEVASAIVGVRRPDPIEQTAAAGDWELRAEVISRIDQLLSRERPV